MRTALMLLLAGLVAAGCAGSRPAGPGPAPSPGPSTPGQAQPLIRYERTGGIAGFHDRLVVLADGSYTVTSRHGPGGTGVLSPAELSELRRLLDSAGFASIPATNPPPYPDGFEHHIWYADREVRAGDGAVPPALGPVVAALATVVRDHGGS
ncbi:MAG TPA: hypothetical protein VFM55_05850 [Micromonosporaceae bacterium]|nr:hypothetical protein [Micromonosporaceae bacterium]